MNISPIREEVLDMCVKTTEKLLAEFDGLLPAYAVRIEEPLAPIALQAEEVYVMMKMDPDKHALKLLKSAVGTCPRTMLSALRESLTRYQKTQTRSRQTLKSLVGTSV